jgi:hypothetical protein
MFIKTPRIRFFHLKMQHEDSKFKKKNQKNPRIRFFHLKMQHDDSKCPKFSSAVEIEHKRLTYKDTIVTSKKVTKPNPFELHHFSHFSQFYWITPLFAFFSILFFIFFRPPDHHFLVAGPVNQQIINMWPCASINSYLVPLGLLYHPLSICLYEVQEISSPALVAWHKNWPLYIKSSLSFCRQIVLEPMTSSRFIHIEKD